MHDTYFKSRKFSPLKNPKKFIETDKVERQKTKGVTIVKIEMVLSAL